MIIALDFDRTLFDTDRDFIVAEERGITPLVGTRAMLKALPPAPFIYPDAASFLSRFKKEELYIVSAISPEYGPEAEVYQKEKIEQSGLAIYVTNVVLVTGAKSPALIALSLQHTGEALFFIDDRVDNLREVHDALPTVQCVLIRRDGALVKGDDEAHSFPIVTNLDEFYTLITSYGS